MNQPTFPFLFGLSHCCWLTNVEQPAGWCDFSRHYPLYVSDSKLTFSQNTVSDYFQHCTPHNLSVVDWAVVGII